MIEKKAQSCKVRILEEEYSLVTSESEQHIADAAGLVDAMLREIMQGSTRVDEKKVAIVTALRLASKALKAEENLRAVQEKQKALATQLDHELQRQFLGNI